MTAKVLPYRKRPIIQLSPRGAELHRDVAQGVDVLRHDSELYQRDGTLVRIVTMPELDGAADRIAPGTPVVRPATRGYVLPRLTRLARFQKWDGRANGYVDCAPTSPVVAGILEQGEWPVPSLVGIAETPILRADGSLHQTKGYDPLTGFYYRPQIEFPSLSDRPSRDDAVKALQFLREPWAEMPWKDGSESPHAFVPVATTLTMLGRPAIRGATPGFGNDGSGPGTGKGLSANVSGYIAHGRAPAVLTWPEKEEELDKMLGALALQGAPVALFDNLERAFGGPPIDKVLTCVDKVQFRVLGESRMPELSWRAIVMVTGNNLQLRRDVVRRMIIGRQESKVERPEQRNDFKYDRLDEHVLRHRARYVAAGLTILRAYIAAGAPAQGLERMGSFESWANLIPSAIVWAGGPDVLQCRPTATGGDEDLQRLSALIGALQRLDPDGTGITVRAAVDAAYGQAYREHLKGEGPPDGLDDVREIFEELVPIGRGSKPDTRRLGTEIRRLRHRVANGKRIEDARASGNRKAWKVVTVS